MTTSGNNTIEALVRRDRAVVVALLLLTVALAWAYLLLGAGMDMSAVEMTRMTRNPMPDGMPGMGMTMPAVWTPGYAVLMFFMWWIMMVAMMLPSAAPMILLFATLNRKQREAGNAHVATSVFAGSYLLAWAGFSVIAVLLQWSFERAGILSPMLVGTNRIFAGVLLLVAGIYQFTPIKNACLRHCRSPVSFLSKYWRAGTPGAFRMGFLHGGYCVGCCWFLMGLLFFGGVMNLYWIIGLALFVLIEKTAPAGHWISYLTGVGLIVWGAAILIPEI